jgi:GDPmannose 4,6-dehydratase
LPSIRATSGRPKSIPCWRCRKGAQQAGLATRTPFKQLVVEMVREDLKSAERDELVKKHGYSAYDYHE